MSKYSFLGLNTRRRSMIIESDLFRFLRIRGALNALRLSWRGVVGVGMNVGVGVGVGEFIFRSMSPNKKINFSVLQGPNKEFVFE
jgi:hypothetical protein